MKYKSYPTYKDSDIEWLGRIPHGWGITRLKFLCSICTGEKDTVDREDDGIYPFFVRSETVERISSYSYDGEAILTAGDGAIGKIFHYINGKFDFHQRVYKFSDFRGVHGRFLFYYISNNLEKEVVKLSARTTVDSLRLPMLQNFIVSLPSIHEQITIARYLDDEVAKIDLMIAKQKRVIELLVEKRSVAISHFVTKGMNADAEFKYSGIDWIGEMPAHWSVKPLRYIGICQNGINIGAEKFGNGYPFVSYGDVYNNKSLPSEIKGLVESSAKDRVIYSVNYGDVFFTRTSETIDEIGFASTSFSEIPNATFAGFLIRFRPFTGIIRPEFSKYYFSNILLRAFFIKEMNLVTRASLSQDLLKLLPVVLPPLDEQKEIGDFLEKQSIAFETLISNAKKLINLLKERRSELIFSAVTGKIDVRNWQPDAKDVA
ncbi:restriction endonuclease subunit S [Salmonella enterica]|uniref:Restriction endonuclease subunit S n=1 Tax=Salmonella enterica subsp. diarizonae serovar 48:i:z TaxID=1192842 RepID=A0A7U5YJ37_SALDZ|nr:restriction endonuclease subunit S [Salmonella enterica]EAA4451991.1 restriction endonuclease subunit S [Salmonella enterica subsp. diarizonae]EDP9919194.1 restriction endonuclease subunit S [Salmonella enterica subsp. enterica serovar Javiana]EDW6116893.1 restriction endonuclease subunit S [Salmonella enterica subsp. salamae]AXC73827.1 restriction endonuclease subunit S [Salmonella enterica subsp. diarizonae serovar 48:i:z]EAM6404557.1 restriction endonuclease subunit S [Salmonella enteric